MSPTRARGKRARRGRGRRRPRAAPPAAGPADRAPAAVRAPAPARGRRPPHARRRRRSRPPSCRSRRASGRAPRGRRAPPASPLSGRTGGLLVRADAGPVEEGHAEGDAALLRHLQQELGDGRVRGRARGTGALRFSAMSEVIESRGAPAWKPMLRACARCWSACPTSLWSASATGRRGCGSSSRSMANGRHVSAAGRCIVTVSARSCWSICRASADRPGWCGASNVGVAPVVGVAGVTTTRRSAPPGVR